MGIFSTYESHNVSLFEEVFTCFNGGTFKSRDYVSWSKNKLITIKNIDDNGFNSDKTSFLQDAFAEEKYRLYCGDILLTMTGNIGRIGLVDDDNCYLNQRVLRVNASSSLYLFCYLQKYKNAIIQLGKGTAQQNLSLQDLNNLAVHNSAKEIMCFQRFDCLFDLLLSYKRQIRVLKNIKALLLSKYFG